MTDKGLRDRIIFMYRYGLNMSTISWILDIPRKDVKRAIKEENILKGE